MSDQWKEVFTDGGERYYWNTRTNKTSWDPPDMTVESPLRISSDDSFDGDSSDEHIYEEIPAVSVISRRSRASTVRFKPTLKNHATRHRELKSFVTIVTGDKMFGGTSHNLHMIFSDENGLNSTTIKISNKGQLFQRNSQYQKEIGINYKNPECTKPFDQFRKLRIWTSGKRTGKAQNNPLKVSRPDDWYLKEIELQIPDRNKSWKFCFNSWIEYNTRYEVAESTQNIPQFRYIVTVKTGSHPDAATDNRILLNLIGSKGDTGMRKLRNSQTHYDKFEIDQHDVFHINAVDIGELEKIKLEMRKKHGLVTTLMSNHLSSKTNDMWFLSSIRVSKLDSAISYLFTFEDWIQLQEKGQTIILSNPILS